MGSTELLWIDWVSIVIAGVAVLVSIGFGISNRRTARRALEVSEHAEARRRPQLDLYVQDSAVWRSPESGTREYGVHFLAVNPADLPSAVVMAELHITYATGEHLSTVKVSGTKAPELAQDIEVIELPQRLGANDAVSGWLVFHVPGALVSSSVVDRYDLVVRDVHDVIAAVQITVFREVGD